MSDRLKCISTIERSRKILRSPNGKKKQNLGDRIIYGDRSINLYFERSHKTYKFVDDRPIVQKNFSDLSMYDIKYWGIA